MEVYESTTVSVSIHKSVLVLIIFNFSHKPHGQLPSNWTYSFRAMSEFRFVLMITPHGYIFFILPNRLSDCAIYLDFMTFNLVINVAILKIESLLLQNLVAFLTYSCLYSRIS